MKIGFVLDDRIDKPDGVQQYVLLLGAWLKKNGHDVHYLVGHSPNATQSNVHHLSRTIGVRFNKNRMAIPLPASSKGIKNLLNKEHFDVLHVQMPYSPLLAGKVVKLASKKTAVIGTFHILPHGKLSELGTRLLSAFLHNSKKRFDGFISVSSAARVFAKSHFGIESTVLPNVVDLTSYRGGRAKSELRDKTNIIFLGRFVERKGAQWILRAYEDMIKYDNYLKSTRLILCGDGPDRQVLERYADKLRQNGADIKFTGFLAEDEKKHYLASADIAVFPATGGESFGIVLIEAMASGAGVVIGGDNDGYKTVLESAPESLVHPQDTDTFSKKLRNLLENTSLLKEIHLHQQKVVEKYDIEHVGPKIVEFYSETLVNRNRK